MQIQCHIVLYLPDYHVNTHRVCSTVKHLRWHGNSELSARNKCLIEKLRLKISTNVENCTVCWSKSWTTIYSRSLFRQPCYCKCTCWWQL